eukprot:m.103178 g.103178  ORF g.103178 m.103178 type:complete len:550 (-) comp14142_c1_seq1:82-1731(-)
MGNLCPSSSSDGHERLPTSSGSDDDRSSIRSLPFESRNMAPNQNPLASRSSPAPLSRTQREWRSIIRQCLVELPRSMTTDQPDPSFERFEELAEAAESNLAALVGEIIAVVPLANPLSGPLISILLDSLPNMPRRDIAPFQDQLLLLFTSDPAVQRNYLTVQASLAEKMAGHMAEFFFTDSLLSLLSRLLEEDRTPLTTLFAIIVCEKYAATGAIKKRILQAGLERAISAIEAKYCNETWSAASHATRSDTLNRIQVAFCATWILDNILPIAGRAYAVHRIDLTAVNVMLDPRDATKGLKLAPDGLDVRNDSAHFESVRATCAAEAGSRWYYEATLLTSGIMQIGWATADCEYLVQEGRGIGDDEHSFAIDCCRRMLWHQGEHTAHRLPAWRPGDVLGAYLDLDKHLFDFAINGRRLGWARLPLPRGVALFPAASLMVYQHLHFNFGDKPFKFGPDASEGFCNLNGRGVRSADHAIVPRLLALERMQAEAASDDEERPQCQICFDSAPEVALHPCKHAEFCAACAEQLERCPLCRAPIATRQPLSSPSP